MKIYLKVITVVLIGVISCKPENKKKGSKDNKEKEYQKYITIMDRFLSNGAKNSKEYSETVFVLNFLKLKKYPKYNYVEIENNLHKKLKKLIVDTTSWKELNINMTLEFFKNSIPPITENKYLDSLNCINTGYTCLVDVVYTNIKLKSELDEFLDSKDISSEFKKISEKSPYNSHISKINEIDWSMNNKLLIESYKKTIFQKKIFNEQEWNRFRFKELIRVKDSVKVKVSIPYPSFENKYGNKIYSKKERGQIKRTYKMVRNINKDTTDLQYAPPKAKAIMISITARNKEYYYSLYKDSIANVNFDTALLHILKSVKSESEWDEISKNMVLRNNYGRTILYYYKDMNVNYEYEADSIRQKEAKKFLKKYVDPKVWSKLENSSINYLE